MAKPKTKDPKIVSFSLDEKIVDRMNKYSKKTFVPKTKIVEQAVNEYLNKMEKKTTIKID